MHTRHFMGDDQRLSRAISLQGLHLKRRDAEGIPSRVLQKDEHVNITLFGFSPGQELSTHSAPTPAVLYFLNGEADVTLGDDVHQAKTGSFAYMPPLLPHAIAAKSATMMLLVQVKLPKRAVA